MDNTIETIERISEDFENQREPFDDVEFPEQRLLDTVGADSMRLKLRHISLFATCDYNRNASQLVDNIIELWNEAGWAFDPHVTEIPLSQEMEEIGFRYPNRDARAWAKNCGILQDKYHSSWQELLLSCSTDAPTLIGRLEDDDFSCLKGAKIAPMYARIINDEVCSLSNVWQLEIPVDTHIRRLSKDLFDKPNATDDWIRREWRGVSTESDISRHVVDGTLWHIGNNWNSWGQDYWERVK